MSWPVSLFAEAEAEFDVAVDWHEARRPGDGEAFAEAVRGVLGRLSGNPFVHQQVFGEVRRAVVPGYRYYVVYYIPGPTLVEVVSVFHTSQDPSIWQSRVSP